MKQSPLPDFFIGAHAAVAGYPLMRGNPARYRTYYPKLTLIAPSSTCREAWLLAERKCRLRRAQPQTMSKWRAMFCPDPGSPIAWVDRTTLSDRWAFRSPASLLVSALNGIC
jgi:hypothetical protein